MSWHSNSQVPLTGCQHLQLHLENQRPTQHKCFSKRFTPTNAEADPSAVLVTSQKRAIFAKYYQPIMIWLQHIQVLQCNISNNLQRRIKRLTQTFHREILLPPRSKLFNLPVLVPSHTSPSIVKEVTSSVNSPMKTLATQRAVNILHSA
jgi:hypothetical protein